MLPNLDVGVWGWLGEDGDEDVAVCDDDVYGPSGDGASACGAVFCCCDGFAVCCDGHDLDEAVSVVGVEDQFALVHAVDGVAGCSGSFADADHCGFVDDAVFGVEVVVAQSRFGGGVRVVGHWTLWVWSVQCVACCSLTASSEMIGLLHSSHVQPMSRWRLHVGHRVFLVPSVWPSASIVCWVVLPQSWQLLLGCCGVVLCPLMPCDVDGLVVGGTPGLWLSGGVQRPWRAVQSVSMVIGVSVSSVARATSGSSRTRARLRAVHRSDMLVYSWRLFTSRCTWMTASREARRWTFGTSSAIRSSGWVHRVTSWPSTSRSRQLSPTVSGLSSPRSLAQVFPRSSQSVLLTALGRSTESQYGHQVTPSMLSNASRMAPCSVSTRA